MVAVEVIKLWYGILQKFIFDGPEKVVKLLIMFGIKITIKLRVQYVIQFLFEYEIWLD